MGSTTVTNLISVKFKQLKMLIKTRQTFFSAFPTGKYIRKQKITL